VSSPLRNPRSRACPPTVANESLNPAGQSWDMTSVAPHAAHASARVRRRAALTPKGCGMPMVHYRDRPPQSLCTWGLALPQLDRCESGGQRATHHTRCHAPQRSCRNARAASLFKIRIRTVFGQNKIRILASETHKRAFNAQRVAVVATLSPLPSLLLKPPPARTRSHTFSATFDNKKKLQPGPAACVQRSTSLKL
jgi:hypothetical protein